jgi:hypothetical protein
MSLFGMANSEAPIGRLAVPGCDNLNRAAGNAAALSAAAARRKATIWLTSPWHVAHCALALRQMHALLRPAGRLFASFTIHVFGTGDFAAVIWESREDNNPRRRSIKAQFGRTELEVEHQACASRPA